MDVDVGGLVGRAAELGCLAALLDEAARDGGALLLTGEPGVGKTALLDAAAGMAAGRGIRVVRGGGVEYESQISFSGLHQLVGPLGAELALLPDSARGVLEVALGNGSGPTPAEMAVLHAALSLFVEAAREQPLLLVVDDLHVLDRASRSVTSFVARRAGGRRIGVLASVRTGIGEPPDRLRLPEMSLAPLAGADAIRLLAHRFSGLPRRVLAKVADQAQGNPLALLEFGALASASGALGIGPTPPGSGPAREVRALYAARVARLPVATRELLLLAALEGSGDVGVLEAAGGAGWLDALGAAERDHLVHAGANGQQVFFRHPLVRSAVVEEATLDQRRAAHRRLAEALADRPERRADHLSMATTTLDEEVARIVEAGARESLRRGDILGAVARLRRAAALSADRAIGSRRLAHAAYIGASVAGHLELSHQLMLELDEPARSRSLPAAAAAGYLSLMTEGDVVTAHKALVEAIGPGRLETAAERDDLSPAVFTLLLVCHYSGRAEDWAPLRRLVATLPPAPASSPVSLVRILEDVGSVPCELLRDLDDQIARLGEVTEADVVIRTALAASYLDRLSGCRPWLTRAVEDGRDSGTVGGALPPLVMSALEDLYAGRWDTARTAAAEIVDLSRDTGYRLLGRVGHYVAALVAAHRGETEACAAHCRELFEWAESRGLGRLGNWAHQALARAALGCSDFETAFAHASAIAAPGELPPYNLEALWTAMDLVEAAHHSGRTPEALKHAAAVRNAGLDRISPRFALATVTVTAMTSPPSEAARLFGQALALPGIELWPFEVARTHLAYGEHLRRQGRRAEARAQLSTAKERFERLGAVPWAGRASAELRATGKSRTGDLTPQEWEVAELAAAGLPTKEIAARLVVSPRTVSAHLYRVFPKLGISSRAALRDALTERRRSARATR
ncbi:AAA family ATPase [Actinoplanes sp. Pm04-4]|uniref:AAA family ATPase n=1 Tax=Paractinoplanes pyxinae TaxID=2997416 RepID=A0ABT4AQ91_9ACTN|nr:LuxR family transcriptional regulator [Actinoplanes pyxinae]MCY1136414.1 AAA family ATPase [Actinoplanes pyxinae]